MEVEASLFSGKTTALSIGCAGCRMIESALAVGTA
jgi:hypothetical protein